MDKNTCTASGGVWEIGASRCVTKDFCKSINARISADGNCECGADQTWNGSSCVDGVAYPPTVQIVPRTEPMRPRRILTERELGVSGKLSRGMRQFQGKMAFQANFKKGKRGPEGSDFRAQLKPVIDGRRVFPAEQCRISYSLWFDPSFDWEPRAGHKVGGKVGGFRVGTGNASGHRYSKDAATFRLTFQGNGAAVAYVYPQLRSDFQGTPSWDQVDQSAEVRAVSKMAAGMHVWKDGNFQMHKGRWNQIEMYMKLNTPGKKDGIIELTVNGVTKRITTMRWRNNSARIENFYILPFFGGGTLEYAPARDTSIWLADFSFTPN